jgi:hypothetical protein
VLRISSPPSSIPPQTPSSQILVLASMFPEQVSHFGMIQISAFVDK